ncbi:hypothetical protein ADJ70_05050 [Olsenella sp. oral taxon 807]|uniref:hypothetical protein n=1 Tax=Olsenella sp. oral taxon 807 TaxID=712411 RepID=UPI000679FEB6|nr:hypothetical protein [Olsenella sp. oral taxon 807]AKT48459.1 hypothetical protein ADJ70_05050 [Olsenella sp. oral taxon 807]
MKKEVRAKIIAVGLALALACIPLSACGGSQNNSSGGSQNTTSSSSSGSSNSKSSDSESSTSTKDSSSSSSDSSSKDSSSSSSDSSSKDSSSSKASDFTISKDEITEAYMGIDTDDEGVYWICNADGSKAGLFILASSGDYISFMGKAEDEGNIITVTDAVSGNAVAIAVTNKGDGTIGLSGGIATTDGTTTNFEATVAPVSVDQAFKTIQGINKYGNMIA